MDMPPIGHWFIEQFELYVTLVYVLDGMPVAHMVGSLAAKFVPIAYLTHFSPECPRGCAIHLLHCIMQMNKA